MDCYWVVRAGIDPYQMIVDNEGRFKEIHLKDMDDTEEKFFAEVGHGVINYSDILENGNKLGVEYFLVEQDRSKRDPMESAKMSSDYLSSLNKNE
jgi:sugar phosphate isomerase/epimerase